MGGIRGRHTELVSVYVPGGYSLVDVVNQLTQERSTAQNIKDKTVRKNVTSALEKILGYLRLVKHTPNNGLVVFCGNISPEPGKVDMELWSFEPPQPMGVKLYRCDQVFLLDPLKELVKEKEIYALIVLDAKEANIGLLKGKVIESLKHMDSTVPSKTVKGGMCVHENTLVHLSDGKIIKIKDLKKADEILSYSFNMMSPKFGSVGQISCRFSDKAYEIITQKPTTKIQVTPEHRFFISTENGFEEKYAEDLKVGDRLLVIKNINSQLVQSKLKQKKIIKLEDQFYDISVPKYQSFIANGLVVHNSQHRYDRLREDAIHDFLKKVGESASQILLKENLKGLVVGGPGWIAEKLAKGDYLNYQIKQKLIGIKSTGYTGEYGLRELVQRSEDLLEKAAVVRERQLLERFFTELKKGGNVTYGVEEVMRVLDTAAVDILLISEAFDWVRVEMKCQCGFTVEKNLPKGGVKEQVCDNCKSPLEVKETKDLAEILAEKAKALGSTVEFISIDTQEGDQFKELGGIGAILRFRIG